MRGGGSRRDRVLAHSDIAPDRKIDPGEFFPWPHLAKAGVGHYVAPCPITDGPRLEPGAEGAEVEELQAMLARYGYGSRSARVTTQGRRRSFAPSSAISGRRWSTACADVSTVATLRKLLAARGGW